MAQLCPDAVVPAGIPLLDCCGICTEFPTCLSIDITGIACIPEGDIGHPGCGEFSTPGFNWYDPNAVWKDFEVVSPGDLLPNHTTTIHPLSHEVVPICRWDTGEDYVTEPIRVLCLLRIVDGISYYSRVKKVTVGAIWDQYNGLSGWNLNLHCFNTYGGTSLMWNGALYPYSAGPLGTYTKTPNSELIQISATPPTITVTECNTAP